jgi:hypothetical protein
MKKGKVGRNDPCRCGSGKKYKHCCGAAGAGPRSSGRWIALAVGVLLLLGALGFMRTLSTMDSSPADRPGQVWSPEHGHWH